MVHYPMQKETKKEPVSDHEAKKSCQSCGEHLTPTSATLLNKDVIVIKKSFSWTDMITMCLMIFVIFSLTVMSLYVVVTMHAGKGNTRVLTRTVSQKVAHDVFYHFIVPRGGKFPFSTYYEYLTTMAKKYPHLEFTIYTLLDDSLFSLNTNQKFTFISNFIYNMDAENTNKLISYLRNHPNANIVFMTVSNFMSATPMRYHYRFVPRASLLLYMRLFSLYQYGGISIDLDTYSNNLYLNQEIDETATSAILSKHNDGFNLIEYGEMMKNLQKDKEEELTFTLYTIFSKIMSNTLSLFSNAFDQALFIPLEDGSESNRPLTRTHRDKRDIEKQIENNSKYVAVGAISENTETKFPRKELRKTEITTDNKITNTAQTTTVKTVSTKSINTVVFDKIYLSSNTVKTNTTSQKENAEKPLDKHNISTGVTANNASNANVTNLTKDCQNVIRIITFYDFERWTGNLVPYHKSSYIPNRNIKNATNENVPKIIDNYLSFDPHGTFIATTSKEHLFLEKILPMRKCLGGLNNGIFQFAMKNVYTELCSNSDDNDYCKNIFVL